MKLLYTAHVISNTEVEQRRLSSVTRVQLAFKLVEWGSPFLGTSWLASLSGKPLRRMHIKGRRHFVLEVQTLNLDDLYFENPDALSEPSSSSSVSLLLVEIALNDLN